MLIIFDCDGVLVDSETLSARAFSIALREIGVEFSEKQCFSQFKGWSSPKCFSWLEQRFAIRIQPEFAQILENHTKALFTGQLKPTFGIEALLKTIKQRAIPYCVASNGTHSKMSHSLALTGLDAYFQSDFRFSSEDVDEPKPAPALFLRAAEAVGVPPTFCVVVEDSISGCIAASRAGMRFVYLSLDQDVPADILELRPEQIVHSISALEEFLIPRHN